MSDFCLGQSEGWVRDECGTERLLAVGWATVGARDKGEMFLGDGDIVAIVQAIGE
jgi:hypothetical protein